MQLQSPIAAFDGYTVPLRIGLSPILRAGIGLTEGEYPLLKRFCLDGTLPVLWRQLKNPLAAALDLFPDATVLHLGLFRDKATLQAIE